MPEIIRPPGPGEYADFHRGYLSAILGEEDAVYALDQQQKTIEALRGISPEIARYRYADGKWSVKEVIGHLADAERVFAYRLFCIARGDTARLPGFDEASYAAASNASGRTVADLVDELAVVRAATLTLVRSLDDQPVCRVGCVMDWSLTVRALAFIIAGHFQHHLNVLRERYGIEGGFLK